MKPIVAAACGLGVIIGATLQRSVDAHRISHANEQRIGAIYRTPKGDNWVLAHIYMPECNGKRIVDAPEKDEVDALSVYCYDGEASTYDELATMAGNQ